MKGKWYFTYTQIKAGKDKRVEIPLSCLVEEEAVAEGRKKWKEISPHPPAEHNNPAIIYRVDL